MDGYLFDREPKVHSDSISYDCATLKQYLGDLPADLLNIEQVRAYVQARRKKGAGGAAAAYRTKRRELSDGTLIRELGYAPGRARMGRQAEVDRSSALR